MKRVIVIGGNGSGKTTFSVKLAEYLKLPLIHLDRIYWKENWEHLSNEEFDNALMSELIKPEWIIDGNYKRTVETRLKYCDTVFYFDFSSLACLYGSITRTIKNYGKKRFDMGGNCTDKFDLEFYKNIILFNKKYRKHYYELLENCKDIKVVIFRNRKQVEKYLKNLKSNRDNLLDVLY